MAISGLSGSSLALAAIAAFRFAKGSETAGATTDSPAAATFQIELHDITRVEDLSPSKRAPLLKTVVERGTGSETPSDGAKVAIELKSMSTGENASATTADGPVELVIGDAGGEGLRRVLMSMTRSEVARVRMHPSLARPPIVAPSDSPDALIELELRLVSFEQQRALDTLSPRELIEHVGRLKNAANAAYAAGDEKESACTQYERAQRVLRLVVEDDLTAAEVSSWRGIQLSLRLNSAVCALRGGKNDQALAQSDAALALDPKSTKALFRRGQALQALGRLSEAETAFVTVTEREPASREAHARLAELRKSMAAA